MASKPNIRHEYDRIFKRNPMAANLLLLLSEMADERGVVQASDDEIAKRMAERFEDPRGYAL